MTSKPSEDFQAHPVHLKNPDFTSLQELPDSFAWTQRSDDDAHYPSTGDSISEPLPLIDLSDPNALHLIGHACKTWGIFQVTNHGVPSTVFDNMERIADTLFSLPVEQKLKASRISTDTITGYGVARIAPFFPKQMWSEGFTILGSPIEHFRKLWPDDYSRYCDWTKEYQEEMRRLAERLLWLILGSLGITKEDIEWAGLGAGDFKESSAALQMNHYPACPDPDRAMGIGPHTDSTIFTILYQNKISGLEVIKEGTGWVTVPPVPGALVINAGDLLHILSNGLCPSVVHRAKVNRSRQRLSIVYLYGGPSNLKISPLSKLLGPSQPPLYRSVNWDEYLRAKAKHFNKALSTFRLCAPPNGIVDVKDDNNIV